MNTLCALIGNHICCDKNCQIYLDRAYNRKPSQSSMINQKKYDLYSENIDDYVFSWTVLLGHEFKIFLVRNVCRIFFIHTHSELRSSKSNPLKY